MHQLLKFFMSQFTFHIGEPGGGGAPQVDVAAARTVMSDFLPADTVKTMDDKAITEHYTRFQGAAGKHFKPVSDVNAKWYDGFQDPNVKEWVRAYGDAYPTPEAMALKAHNLEKFVGAEKAGRGVVMPKSDAPPAEWKQFWAKTGLVPADVKGYKVDAKALSEPFTAKLVGKAHELGVPAPLLSGLMQFLDSEGEALVKADMAEFSEKAKKDLTDLHTEWGADRDANIEHSSRAARFLLPHKTPDELRAVSVQGEGAFGTKNWMNMLAKLGKAMSEHNFVDADLKGGDSKSQEAAKLEIANLKKDSEFAKKFAAGDADAKKRLHDLHVIAFPAEAPQA